MNLSGADEHSAFAQEVENAEWIAIDTEFHSERRYLPKLFLVQVQVPNGSTWLFDPLVEGTMERIAPVLLSTPWAVHGGSQDLRILRKALGGTPPRVTDSQVLAGLIGLKFPGGFGMLVETILGESIAKSATLSDWSKRPLGKEQLTYAAEDVILLVPLIEELQARVDALGRTQLAVDANRAAADAALATTDPQTAWRSISASRSMTAQQRLILRELCAWREQRARSIGSNPRSVLSDGLAIDWSKRPPASMDAFLQNRRLPRALAKLAEPLVATIQRAQATPEEEAPQVVPSRGQAGLAFDLLTIAVKHWCLTNQLSMRLIAPQRLLEDFFLSGQLPQSAWQAPTLTPILASITKGEWSYALRDGNVQRGKGSP